MTWTGQNFSVGQILTAPQMNNLQADITAHANGDSGAPKQQTDGIADGAVTNVNMADNAVGQSEMRNSAIGRAELKSTTATQSVGPSSNGYTEISLTGSNYTMFWTLGAHSDIAVGVDVDDVVEGVILGAHNDGGYAAKVAMALVGSSGGNNVYLYSRYIQSSPPWIHGETEVPLYILAMLDRNTQEVLGTYAAQDPPWAYHGPHNLHPVDGRLDKAFGFWGKSIAERRQDPEFIEKLREMKRLKRQSGQELYDLLKANTFSMEEKHIDMDLAPHLFSNFDEDKHVVVMLDPGSALTEEHALLQEFVEDLGDEHISKLLHNGYVSIDNASPLDLPGPSKVQMLRYSMKLTKG